MRDANPGAAAAHLQSRGHILSRFTLSYFLLLLIPAALCVCSYITAMNLAKSSVMENQRLVLSHALQRLESSVSEAEHLTLTLSQMGDISTAMQQPQPTWPHALFAINKAIEQLPRFTDSNGIITSYMLYSVIGDYILAPSMAFLRLPLYYESSLWFEGLDYAAWHSRVLDMSRITGMLPASRHIQLATGMAHSLALFRPYIPVVNNTGSGRIAGKAIFLLSVDKIEQMLQPTLTMGAKRIDLTDRSGALLAQYGEEGSSVELPGSEGTLRLRLDGEDTFVIYQTSGPLGLCVASHIPMRTIIRRCNVLLGTLIAGMFALMLAGICLAVSIARLNRRPLRQLIGGLPEGNGMNSLWDVDRAVRRLAHQQTLLEAQLFERQSQMRSTCVHQLVNGVNCSELELEAMLGHADLVIHGSVYRGIYMEVPEDREITEDSLTRADHTQDVVRSVLEPYNDQVMFLALLDHAHYILLYMTDGEDDGHAALGSLLGEVYQKLKAAFGLQTQFFVGHLCTSLQKLHHSYAVAMRMMESNNKTTAQFLRVAETDQSAEKGYLYSVRDEQRLTALAGKGDFSAIEEELACIFQRNFVQAQLSDFMRQLLYSRMIGTLALSNEYQTNAMELEDGFFGLSGMSFFEALGTHYARWCAQSLARIENYRVQLIKDVILHIETRFMDAGMGLASVAIRFGVTESYLSGFFKEKVGKTFSAYLESIRIRHANHLLLTTQQTIEGIAKQVGYTNDDSFRRAYRRLHGYTPSQHRNLLI